MVIRLDGKWMTGRVGHDKMGARVPGTVYEALLNNGCIGDPFWRDNEEQLGKVCDDDYEFMTTFDLQGRHLEADAISLVFEGLDTLAEITLNDKPLAFTYNMHRTYDFSVKSLLKLGENKLSILFRSPNRYVEKMNGKKPLWGVNDTTMAGFSHLRKAHYMFGWDWGPILPDMGVWKSVYLRFSHIASLEEVHFSQNHHKDGVDLNYRVKAKRYTDKSLKALLEITHPEGQSQSIQQVFDKNEITFSVTIDRPKLWWPNGYGEQPLYSVRVTLLAEDLPVDSKEYKIGLKEISLLTGEDQWGREFAFKVNGEKIFIRGANYIPEDSLLGRRTPEKTERLIRDCATAHFNMLRVWGGGHYADDHFLDLCDQRGILVWQDFAFACAQYDLTEDMTRNIVAEAEDNIRRMRHHACLALWCGNNEIEIGLIQWGIPHNEKLRGDYITLFERILPELVDKNDPQTDYWPSSPTSYGGFDRTSDFERGDTHYWDVWHGMKPFEAYQNYYFRFLSEFGFQSFPSMKTIESYTQPQDRNIFSYVMERHQKNASANGKIVTYLAEHYLFPKDLKQLVYASQLLQAEAVAFGVEHMRRNRGRCMGTLYWQLNDCWPVASWSGIDYYGRWKALHYAAQNFYAPVLLSAQRKDKTVRLNVSNERTSDFTGEVRWALRKNDGSPIRSGSLQVHIARLSTKWLDDLELEEELSDIETRRELYLDYSLMEGSTLLSQKSLLFVRPKHFVFLNPNIQVSVEEAPDAYQMYLSSQTYAKSVELSLEQVEAPFSDNYFDLTPGSEKRVILPKSQLNACLSAEELQKRLGVNSVYDLG